MWTKEEKDNKTFKLKGSNELRIVVKLGAIEQP